MRIKLIIEYDGTEYAGWQRQENAIAVQQLVEEAISTLTKEKTVITGAGRTDSGVHAWGQVAHFDTNSTIPPEKFAFALNTMLPESIRIRQSMQVQDDFHARYGAKSKTYIYKIYNNRHSSPLMRIDHAHVPMHLDEERMNRAAQYFVGEHDFAAFATSDKRKGSTVRIIYNCQVARTGDELTITVTGNGFLYNMVRIISGTLIQVGLNKTEPEEIMEMLEKKDRKLSGVTAPPNGLTLYEIFY